MTPNDIDVLMHYFCSDKAHPRIKSPAVRQSIELFVENGMLDDDGSFTVTDKGRAMVTLLCNTPEPRQSWVDGNGEVIDVSQ